MPTNNTQTFNRYNHRYNLWPPNSTWRASEAEQRGCKIGCLGTIDHLLLNKTILKNCKLCQTNLSTAWIDYKKAFDSVPHSWIIKCMQVYKIDPQIVTLIEKAMMLYNTTLILPDLEGKIDILGVKIWRGILQGDSLSPLLFCLALDPLSNLINKQGHGYNLICYRIMTRNKKGDTPTVHRWPQTLRTEW